MKHTQSLTTALLIALAACAGLASCHRAPKASHTFALGDSAFLLDGKPFQIISGEMHYARIPREAWKDRMKMAKAMGLNTISTYVFWNYQEPQKGVFDFSGNHDIAAFVKDAQQEGLWVILRPSPYVCAEWEFGGYPYWLQNEKGLVVRSSEKQYMHEYETYIKRLGKELSPLLITHGGPVLMVQIENEYGFYGKDKAYLAMNKKLFREAGFDGVLYTCDPPRSMDNGYLPGVLPAVNGLDKPREVKAIIRKHHDGKGPFFISEWYPAWFDWWGAPHHTVPAEKYAGRLDSVLAAGISINMYMFHGGTTRGFMNGANCSPGKPYEPEISSYDYDAPLNEAGNATPKFMVFRSVIQKHLPQGVTLPAVPAPKPVIAISDIDFTGQTELLNTLPAPLTSSKTLTFEDLKQPYGYVLYRTVLDGGRSGLLKLIQLRDYAIVMVNGERAGVLDRRLDQDSMRLELPKGKDTVDILVENLGRINFGPYLLQNKKGITEKATFAGQDIDHWKIYSLPFDNLDRIRFDNQRVTTDGPVIRKGTFNVEEPGDTYLDMSSWGKGVVWVNGHNLGRYWYIGPQQTLYVPWQWLKKGKNEIEVLELLRPRQHELQGVEKPVLDSLQQDLNGPQGLKS
jgi:beta-galactosidase